MMSFMIHRRTNASTKPSSGLNSKAWPTFSACVQSTPAVCCDAGAIGSSLDAVVDVRLGEETRALLAAAGYPVEWHRYPMAHAVCAEELAAIAAFLQRVL